MTSTPSVESIALAIQENGSLQSLTSRLSTGVYLIYCTKNSKGYIGSARTWFEDRWDTHENDLVKEKHDNRHLQNAWNLYGADSFEFLVLEPTQVEDALDREQYYLDLLWDTGMLFNMVRTAGGGFAGPISDETRMAMSVSGKIRWASNPESRTAMSLRVRNLWETVEYREMQHKSRSEYWEGNTEARSRTSELFKKMWCDEALDLRGKQSNRLELLWEDPDYRLAQVNAMLDRWKDPAYRSNHVSAMTDRWKDSEYRLDMTLMSQSLWKDETYRAARMAVRRSPEHIAKQVAAAQLRWSKPGIREQASQAAIIRWSDPAEHEKQSVAQQARWEKPEEREKASQGQLRRYSDPLEKEKSCLIAKERWKDPETRIRQSAFMKEVWRKRKAKQSENFQNGHKPEST